MKTKSGSAQAAKIIEANFDQIRIHVFLQILSDCLVSQSHTIVFRKISEKILPPPPFRDKIRLSATELPHYTIYAQTHTNQHKTDTN